MAKRGRKPTDPKKHRKHSIRVYLNDDEFLLINDAEKSLKQKLPALSKQDVVRAALLRMDDVDLLIKLGLFKLTSLLFNPFKN